MCIGSTEVLSKEIDAIGKEQLRAACSVVFDGYEKSASIHGLRKESDAKISYKTLVVFARHEIHVLLCTGHERYAEERAKIGKAQLSFVSFIAGLTTAKFGIEAGGATAVAITCLILPLKMGIQAWCAAYRDTHLSREEQRILRGIADNPNG